VKTGLVAGVDAQPQRIGVRSERAFSPLGEGESAARIGPFGLDR